MRTELESLENNIARLGRAELLARLRSGRERTRLRRDLSRVGIVAPPELLELYDWHDGTNAAGARIGDICLIPGYYMLSVGDAVSAYRGIVASEGYQSTWLPFLADGGGYYYVVDLESDVPAVRLWMYDESDSPALYGSLTRMIATFNSAYEKGIFFVDDRGELESDDVRFAAHASSLNPEISWWREYY